MRERDGAYTEGKVMKLAPGNVGRVLIPLPCALLELDVVGGHERDIQEERDGGSMEREGVQGKRKDIVYVQPLT